MARKAAIDIGTNSTRLLIAEVSDAGQIVPLNLSERITRLGEGLNMANILRPDAMNRVLDALLEFRALIATANVIEIHLFATSATREAKNKIEFIGLIREKLSWDCRILSGVEEAHLSFLGAMSELSSKKPILVCDIGGGSTELVVGSRRHIELAKSLPLGTRRLTERFVTRDPVQPQQIFKLNAHIRQELVDGFEKLPPVRQMVCVGGTATTLAMMDGQIDIGHPEKSHGYRLTKASVVKMIDQLQRHTLAERKNLVGLHPDRADVILTGAVIVHALMSHFRQNDAMVSIRDLLFGILIERELS